MVNLMFGSDTPKLTRMIISEMEKEQKVLAGEAERKSFPISKLAPEEVVRKDAKEKLKRQKLAEEEAIRLQAELEKYNILLQNIEKEFAKNKTLVLFMPYLLTESGTWDGVGTIMEKVAKFSITLYEEMRVVFTPEQATKFFYGTVPITDEFLEELDEKECLVRILEAKPPVVEEVELEDEEKDEDEISGESELYQPLFREEIPAPVHEEIDILAVVAKIVYGRNPPDQPNVKQIIEPSSIAAHLAKSDTIPAIWTPSHKSPKVECLLLLMSDLEVKYAEPEPEPDPPQLAMIFDPGKSRDVQEMMGEYANEVLHVGYFDNADPLIAKKIGNTYREYLQYDNKVGSDRLVIVIKKVDSDPLLSFAQLMPTYISPSIEDGLKDAKQFFGKVIPQEEVIQKKFIEPVVSKKEEILTVPIVATALPAVVLEVEEVEIEKVEEVIEEESEELPKGEVIDIGPASEVDEMVYDKSSEIISPELFGEAQGIETLQEPE